MSFFANLLGNYITGRLLGGKKGGNIAALGTAVPFLLQQGLGSDGFSLDSLFGGGKQSDPVTKAVTNMAKVPMSDPKADEVSQISKVADAVSSKAAIDPVFKQGEGTLGYSKFLVDAGFLDPNSKIANLLNTKVGEALATGLGSSLASKLSGSGGGSSGSVSSPFGGGRNLSIDAIRPIEVAAGGYIDGQYFPRRNGGIMPSEGSGQKDDVPAMLMAGEFVLTKDAVKGLGDGDSNRGIEKAYSMMNKLENKANNYV
jgi:hypothetical protein